MTTVHAMKVDGAANEACSLREAPPKWSALVDDILVPMPQRRVLTKLIRDQASVPVEYVIVRDHNSPDDVVLDDDQVVDLADGNVFYRLPKCDGQPRAKCTAPPKLAISVDDRVEVTMNPHQTGRSLRDLFSLHRHVRIVRDVESPDDVQIGTDDLAAFGDGPVFYTRKVESRLSITVNSQIFTAQDGVRQTMTGAQIAALVFGDNPQATKITWQSNGDREIGQTDSIHLLGCDVFHVTRCEVIGGYERSRVELELMRLREGGAEVSFITAQGPAVIFHAMPTRPGSTPASTDVLVQVPSGYPGGMIDGAYLPANSPLIGRVVGSPQHQFTIDGRGWQLISYHPHNGGGAPTWNPMKHGFHTYYGELLSWLHNAK